MRIPDPKANTTTEAYLAYKAGYLEESELKPVLYEPYLHFDAWLAYWAGLTTDYPVKNVGKNLFNKNAGHIISGFFEGGGEIIASGVDRNRILWLPCKPNASYVVKSQNGVEGIGAVYVCCTETRPEPGTPVSSLLGNGLGDKGFKTPSNACYIVIRYQSPVGVGIQDFIQGIADTLQVEEKASTPATAYEPYTGEPEMLTDEEALVAYLSGVTNTYPEEIKDPYDVRIVGYLKHLVSIRWPEPDYPVNNEEFYLSTMEPTHTSNPVPSSDIELDTAEGKIISVEAYGDTYQQTYSGKNLFNAAKAPDIVNLVGDVSFDENTYTLSVPSNSSTSSGNRFAGFYLTYLQEGATYTISYLEYTGSIATDSRKISVRSYDGSTATVLVTLTDSKVDSFTVPVGSQRIEIFFYTTQDTTSTFSKVQLEEGSTSTAYVPYVGGIASPNPDYPQDVQVVTGRQVVKVNGKNLFDKNNADILIGYINASGVIKHGANTDAMFYIPCSPNTTYTVQKGLQTTTSKNRFRIGTTQAVPQYEDTVSDFWRMADGGLDTVHTIVTSSNAKYLVVYCYGNDTEMTRQSLFDTVQVEKGSTATTYEPYQSQSYEINLGKNLFDQSNATQYRYLSDATGAVSTSTNPDTYAGLSYIPCSPNTEYTLSGGTRYMRIAEYTYDKSFVKTVNSGNSSTVVTIKTGDDGAYLRVSYHDATGGNAKIQLELGSTATSYAPYFEPIELCKIGDYQDYIYKSGDDWYVHKECGRHTFDGSEEWTYIGGTPPFYYQLTPKIGQQTTNGKLVFSNYFLPTSTWGEKKVGIWLDRNVIIKTEDSLAGTGGVNAFKTWLSTHNTIVYYALATPTDTKITDATLAGQLGALAGADTYNEKTYIKVTATNPNLPALLKVEAYKY